MTISNYLALAKLKNLIDLSQSTKELAETFLQISTACIKLEDIINDLAFNEITDEQKLKSIDSSIGQIYDILMEGLPFIRKELHQGIFSNSQQSKEKIYNIPIVKTKFYWKKMPSTRDQEEIILAGTRSDIIHQYADLRRKYRYENDVYLDFKNEEDSKLIDDIYDSLSEKEKIALYYGKKIQILTE